MSSMLEKTPSIKFSRKSRILFAVILVIVWMVIRQQVSQIDYQFFQPSLSGMKGLALYLVGDYSGSAKAYRNHFQESYRTERTAADPGWDALLRGDYPSAKVISNKALETDSFAVGPLLTLGQIALDEGALDQALALFQRVLQKETDQFDAALLSSVAHARAGNDAKAIDSLNQALRHSRVEKRITSFLTALEMTGDLKRRPKGKGSFCLLAHYYRYLRIFDDSNGKAAIRYAIKAIAVGDHPADAYFTLGVIYDKRRKSQEALPAFLKAIALNPKHAEALRWASIQYGKQGDLINEYQMAKTSFEAEPDTPVYSQRLIYVLTEKLGDFHQARDLLEQALKINPKNVTALNRLGSIYASLGEHEQSIRIYRQAVLLKPNNPKNYEGIGTALDLLGRTEEALAAFQKAVALDPYRASPHSSIASLYHGQKRYREAIVEYELAFRLGDQNLNRMATLCAVYQIVSEFQHAVDCFRKVLSKDPDNTLAQRMYPEALHNLELKRPK